MAGTLQITIQCWASGPNPPDYPAQESEESCAQFKKEALTYVETLREVFVDRLKNEQPSPAEWVTLPNGKAEFTCYPEMALAFFYYEEALEAAWKSIRACESHAAATKKTGPDNVNSIPIHSFQETLNAIDSASFSDLFTIDTKTPPKTQLASAQNATSETFLSKFETYARTVRDGYNVCTNPEKFVTAMITDKAKAVVFKQDNYALTYEVYQIAYKGAKEGGSHAFKASAPLAKLVDEVALRKLVNMHSQLLRAVDECCKEMGSVDFTDTSHWDPPKSPRGPYNDIDQSRALFESDFDAWAAALRGH